MTPKKFIISGGGTGGHVYPAIAIAISLKDLNPDNEILFIGAKGKMEMEKVPQAGFPIVGLWISGLQRKLTLKNLLFPLKLVVSLLRTFFVIIKFKPDAVVGVGGFASGPTLRVAAMLGIPVFIQEQNSFPGITNRIMAKKATKICVAYPGLEKFFPKEKVVMTGNPVRQDILELEDKKIVAYQHFGLDPHKKTLLVVGGSLGARSINLGIEKYLKDLIDLDIQILWQTGKSYTIPNDLPEGVKAKTFIEKMDLGYAVADFVVSRAGALAVSEIALVKIPAILVPYPFASEDHQTKNAKSLVDGGAAILLADSKVQDDLLKEVTELVQNETRSHEIKENIKQFGFSNSSKDIAKEIIDNI